MTKTKKMNNNGNGRMSGNGTNNGHSNTNLYNFAAKTPNQKLFIRSIYENILTICYGCAGTGKSMCSIGVACQQLKNSDINNIVVSKPLIGCDNELGTLPGTVNERIHPYMYPILEYFEFFLGRNQCSLCLNQSIHLFPIELIRGHTYHNSLMILEEAQNCTPKQIKLFMSRIGQNSKIIVIGDNRQSDIQNNGLQFCIDNFLNVKDVNVVEFNRGDILRNKIIPDILDIFEKKGV
jgi:phosphate starvation-inducible PhoH-like protein